MRKIQNGGKIRSRNKSINQGLFTVVECVCFSTPRGSGKWIANWHEMALNSASIQEGFWFWKKRW